MPLSAGASRPGDLVAELTGDVELTHGEKLGITTAEPVVAIGADSAPIDELLSLSEGVLEDVYPTRAGESAICLPARVTLRLEGGGDSVDATVY